MGKINEQRKAPVTHCPGHSLSLAIKDANKLCRTLNEVMGTEAEIILQNYMQQMEVWYNSLKENFKADVKSRILGYKAQMESFKFFYVYHDIIIGMKKVKGGATKRREKAAAREEIANYPKLTYFLKPLVQNRSVSIPTETTNNSDCHYLNTRVESDRLICESTSNGITIPPIFLSDDPSEWHDNVSDAQRCDIVKSGFKKIEIVFAYNLERRRFSLNYYNRKMKNGEIFERTWLIYSLNSNKVFCFCCKLFGITSSPFRQGMNTWEGLSKKLKEHETCSAHFKCFEQWMTL
ncbi:uncharacterized protein LOC136081296 [Hydra vulgaris]|uniref:Uncharacterized protein LOC136081296 n=1 Tax=Hydra vulgaris TaxID=6087 RepID=A0ABM4BZI5_HYDVU